MPTRVLAFESDAQFARKLETEFRSLGCEITVVDDVNSGLQAASASRPDLILLTIELPRMSGYSVCNRIKRDADLKEIPLIIMSSESTDQTFEQHRRLGTRAQDYIRKPVTFGALLERAKKFVDIKPVSLLPEDDGIVIDDEIEISEDISSPAPSGHVSPSLRPIDPDIEDFAEHAFGSMMDSTPAAERPAAVQSEVPGSLPSSPRIPTNLSVDTASSVLSLDQERVNAELERLRAQVEEKEKLLAEALAEVRELKRASRVAENDANETEDLKREIRELKAKLGTPSNAPKPSIGPSAREFLDLREQLNRKDKELLDLRDQITHKDKELLGLRDATLAHERDKADLADKLDELTRQFADLQKISDAARADKEVAAKRADDFKRKSEKFVGLLEEKTAELDRALARHAAELSEKDEHRERLVAEHAASLEAARSEYVRGLADAEKENRAALERAVDEVKTAAESHERQALETVREAALEQLNAALTDLEQRLRSEHAGDKSGALTELERSLRAELATDKAQALAQAQSERDAVERQLETRIDGLRQELERRNAELSGAREEIRQREERIAQLEGTIEHLRGDLEQSAALVRAREESLAKLQTELGQQKVETTEALDLLSTERRRLRSATEKWNEDRRNLERVKDALAAALVQVETIEARTLE